MRRLLILMVLLVIAIGEIGICSIGFAEDYWMYIRTYNRHGVTASDDVGRSKKGDIVDIFPVQDHPEPSEKEKQEWAIIKVSGLTKKDVERYQQAWIENEGKENEQVKCYRRYKIDVDSLRLRKGKNAKIRKHSILKNKIKQKTNIDLISYKREQRLYALWRPLRYAYHRIVKSACAENVSTINKPGEDYNTLTLWEDAKDGDLIGETRQETAECYDDDGVLDDTIVIDGSTTNATYYMKITVSPAERHDGTLPDGTAGDGFVIRETDRSNCIQIQDGYTIVEWVAVDYAYNRGGGYRKGINIYEANNSTLRYCIVRGNANTGPWYRGIAAFSICSVYNCIVYDFLAEESKGISCAGGDNSGKIYNCTVQNCTRGITSAYKDGIVENNLVSDCRVSCYDSDFSIFNYNWCDDTSGASLYGGDIGNINTDTPGWNDVIYVDESGDNFHLVASGAADKGPWSNGTDLSATFTDDIDGETRTGTWDMGADEFESSNANPTATALATPPTGTAPLEVSFTGSGTDPDGWITSYSWDFGDGETSLLQNPIHTYDSPANYTATLTVTDNDGLTDTASVAITVSDSPGPAAVIPPFIRFQARLENTAGGSLDGSFTFTFRLYDTDTGGTPIWEEIQQGVDVEEGCIDAKLGSVTTLNLPFDRQYWLGVEVNSDGEMSPRFELTTVPYSFKSKE